MSIFYFWKKSGKKEEKRNHEDTFEHALVDYLRFLINNPKPKKTYKDDPLKTCEESSDEEDVRFEEVKLSDIDHRFDDADFDQTKGYTTSKQSEPPTIPSFVKDSNNKEVEFTFDIEEITPQEEPEIMSQKTPQVMQESSSSALSSTLAESLTFPTPEEIQDRLEEHSLQVQKNAQNRNDVNKTIGKILDYMSMSKPDGCRFMKKEYRLSDDMPWMKKDNRFLKVSDIPLEFFIKNQQDLDSFKDLMRYNESLYDAYIIASELFKSGWIIKFSFIEDDKGFLARQIIDSAENFSDVLGDQSSNENVPENKEEDQADKKEEENQAGKKSAVNKRTKDVHMTIPEGSFQRFFEGELERLGYGRDYKTFINDALLFFGLWKSSIDHNYPNVSFESPKSDVLHKIEFPKHGSFKLPFYPQKYKY